MAKQLARKRLAKTHNLQRALAFGVKVRAPFAAAHRKRRERIFEGLLESQKLQNGQINRGMKTQTAFVGANGRTVLDAVTAVDLDFASVINP